jgi:hypothetical protein
VSLLGMWNIGTTSCVGAHTGPPVLTILLPASCLSPNKPLKNQSRTPKPLMPGCKVPNAGSLGFCPALLLLLLKPCGP